MEKIQNESNIKPVGIVIDSTIIDVNKDITETERDGEKFYTYTTYRFDRSEVEGSSDYELKINALIRCKYSLNDELAIQRKNILSIANEHKISEEFLTYNNYVEICKTQAKEN